MRTTLTLDPDTEALVRQRMRERSESFKQAVNGAIRDGVRRGTRGTPAWPTFDMGQPTVNLEKALQLAGELEDEEIIRKIRTGR